MESNFILFRSGLDKVQVDQLFQRTCLLFFIVLNCIFASLHTLPATGVFDQQSNLNFISRVQGKQGLQTFIYFKFFTFFLIDPLCTVGNTRAG